MQRQGGGEERVKAEVTPMSDVSPILWSRKDSLELYLQISARLFLLIHVESFSLRFKLLKITSISLSVYRISASPS